MRNARANLIDLTAALPLSPNSSCSALTLFPQRVKRYPTKPQVSALELGRIILTKAGIIAGLQRALEASPASNISALCHLGTSHFSSEFKTLTWGCGYNNAQVLLSYLKEAAPKHYRQAFGDDIPSIRRLQTLIEEGWKKGRLPVLWFLTSLKESTKTVPTNCGGHLVLLWF